MAIKSLCIAIMALLSSVAIADTGCRIPTTRHQSEGFFISGILQKTDQAGTVKLVHSVEMAKSEHEALGSFVKKVETEYPGYSIADTLVSSANGDGIAKCPVVSKDNII